MRLGTADFPGGPASCRAIHDDPARFGSADTFALLRSASGSPIPIESSAYILRFRPATCASDIDNLVLGPRGDTCLTCAEGFVAMNGVCTSCASVANLSASRWVHVRCNANYDRTGVILFIVIAAVQILGVPLAWAFLAMSRRARTAAANAYAALLVAESVAEMRFERVSHLETSKDQPSATLAALANVVRHLKVCRNFVPWAVLTTVEKLQLEEEAAAAAAAGGSGADGGKGGESGKGAGATGSSVPRSARGVTALARTGTMMLQRTGTMMLQRTGTTLMRAQSIRPGAGFATAVRGGGDLVRQGSVFFPSTARDGAAGSVAGQALGMGRVVGGAGRTDSQTEAPPLVFALQKASRQQHTVAKRPFPNKLLRALRCGTRPTRCTVMSLNADRFHDWLEGRLATSTAQSHSAVARQIGQYHDTVLQTISQNLGVADAVLGDHVLASWNTSLDCADHLRRACGAACELVGAQPIRDLGVRLSIGIATGHAAVGVVGAPRFKHHVVLSGCVREAVQLCRVARRTRVEVSVLWAHEEMLRDEFVLRFNAVAAFEGRPPLFTAELVAPQADERWHVAPGELEDIRTFNAAMDALGSQQDVEEVQRRVSAKPLAHWLQKDLNEALAHFKQRGTLPVVELGSCW
jgi:hypothetical protein